MYLDQELADIYDPDGSHAFEPQDPSTYGGYDPLDSDDPSDGYGYPG